MPMTRATRVHRELTAGCFDCSGDEAKWTGANAQGIAARHHDASGHATWCNMVMTVAYGRRSGDPRQIDLEDHLNGAAA